MTQANLEPSGEPGFDEVLERLRAVVGKLEQGNLTLEESLRAYEEGVGLARRGHALLDRADRRVELLVRGASAASDRVVPLEGQGGPEGEPPA